MAISATRQGLKLLPDLLAPECSVDVDLRLAALDELTGE